MPLALTPSQLAAVNRLRAAIMAGQRPLIDHSLLAESTTAVAAGGAAGSTLQVRPYENGVIVELDGVAFDDGGNTEVDTMAERMHEKYLGVMLKVAGRPKTNDTYEPMYTLTPKAVCWVVAQNDLIEVTFKHLAASGIASLQGKLKFGFVPFSELGI